MHQVLGWCGLSAVDPALTAEVVLRLALVFEAFATLDDKKNKSGMWLLIFNNLLCIIIYVVSFIQPVSKITERVIISGVGN